VGHRRGAVEDLGVTRDFWAGKRVFLTGHTGFKGAWLTLWLKSLGAEVRGFALAPPTRPNLFDVAGVGDAIESVTGDITDADALSKALNAHRPGVVFHLAAQALVRESYRDPAGTFASNVMGTVNVLEAVRRTGRPAAVVLVTSDKCYENHEWSWAYRENDRMGGRDPYAASKGAAELAVNAWRESFFRGGGNVRVASARGGNVIGGGDWADDRLLPDCVRAMESGTPLVIRRPDAVRPWQHVLDALHGYLILAERLSSPDGDAYARGWNFGPDAGEAVSVAEMVRRFRHALGGRFDYRVMEDDGPHEAKALTLDSGLARSHLGWHPRVSLGQAIGSSAAWYLALSAGEDIRAVTMDQIAAFMSEKAVACA